MKHIAQWSVLAVLVLALASCGNAFHNGTEMTVSQVKITGLPSSPYAPGKTLVFDLCVDQSADLWVHSDFNNAAYDGYRADVAADGSLTFNFSPALVIKTATIKFLIIDQPPNWNVVKIDNKHSGKSGGDVVLDNIWAPTTIVGVVKGDDVKWNLE